MTAQRANLFLMKTRKRFHFSGGTGNLDLEIDSKGVFDMRGEYVLK